MDMRLYQFIRPEHALHAIGLRRLKISRLDQLNDPFEMFAGTQADPTARLGMRLFRDSIAPFMGILCFSRSWQNPVMWGHYADSHRGVCLGFDVDDGITMPVKYVNKRLNFDDYSEKWSAEKSLRLMTQIVSTKYSHWKYENEVRCWHPLNPNNDDIQFHYFGKQIVLREVFIGFQSDIKREHVIAALGDELEDGVKIINTRLAFRTFKVVTQRNRQLWR